MFADLAPSVKRFPPARSGQQLSTVIAFDRDEPVPSRYPR
jgi:hypothetical protein